MMLICTHVCRWYQCEQCSGVSTGGEAHDHLVGHVTDGEFVFTCTSLLPSLNNVILLLILQ